MEISNLSDIELKQRNLVKPEFFRKMNTIIDGFTIIDFIHTLISIFTVAIWIIYNQTAYSADIYNTPITDGNNDNDLIYLGENPLYIPTKNFFP